VERLGAEERRVKGTGMGRVVKWNRKARVNYVHCWTGKGNLQAWRHKLDGSTDLKCRKCGKYAETGRRVALVCAWGGVWQEVGDVDVRERWMKKVKDPDWDYVVDLVETPST